MWEHKFDWCDAGGVFYTSFINFVCFTCKQQIHTDAKQLINIKSN